MASQAGPRDTAIHIGPAKQEADQLAVVSSRMSGLYGGFCPPVGFRCNRTMQRNVPCSTCPCHGAPQTWYPQPEKLFKRLKWEFGGVLVLIVAHIMFVAYTDPLDEVQNLVKVLMARCDQLWSALPPHAVITIACLLCALCAILHQQNRCRTASLRTNALHSNHTSHPCPVHIKNSLWHTSKPAHVCLTSLQYTNRTVGGHHDGLLCAHQPDTFCTAGAIRQLHALLLAAVCHLCGGAPADGCVQSDVHCEWVTVGGGADPTKPCQQLWALHRGKSIDASYRVWQ